MENNLPDHDPLLPTTETENVLGNQPTPSISSIQLTPKKFALSPILIALVVIGAFSFGYFLSQPNSVTQDNKIDNSQSDSTKDQQVSPITSVSKTVEKTKPEFLIIKQNASHDDQPWTVSLDGTESQLFLPDFFIAYKHPNSQNIFFTKTNSDRKVDGSVFVKNISSNETKQYELIKHPKPEVNEGISINNLDSIAPDDSAFVYSVYFTQDCPPASISPGFEGGFGPCEPDPDPNLPAGFYLYDLKTKNNIFLGDEVIPSTWDLENRKFYFSSLDAQDNGLKMVNLDTKEVTMFDRAETFGYGAYPLLKSKFIIKIEGQTGDVTGQESSSVLSLYNVLTKEKKILDRGRWAAIQPFASVSPNETKFLYIRSTLDSQSRAVYSLYSYDFETGQAKRATPESMVSSYSIYGNWLDEDNFVTMAIEVDTNNNDKKYLVKIDLKNEQVTKLTDDDVYRFNSN